MGKLSNRKWKWKKKGVANEEAIKVIEDRQDARDVEAQNLADELFSIDADGNAEKRGKKRERRGQVSFKKKDLYLSDSEMLRVDKMVKKLKSKAHDEARLGNQKDPEHYDLWNTDMVMGQHGNVKTLGSHVRAIQPRPASRPERLMDNIQSHAPAVKHAHNGQSINPKREAYEDLVAEAAAKEFKKQAQADELERRFKPVTSALVDKFGEEAVKKMTEEEKIAAFVGPQEEIEIPACPPKKQPEPKTTTQRNREARHKAVVEAQQKAKEEEKFLKSINNVGKEINAYKKNKKRLEQKRQFEQERADQVVELESKGIITSKLKIGKYAFEEPAEMVTIPKEGDAPESTLRQARLAMGGAIRDRVASIFRRGMLPAPPSATKDRFTTIKATKNRKVKSTKYINAMMRDKNNLVSLH